MFDQYEHIAIRAGDPGLNIGDIVPNSYRWDDGEITDEQLNGACGIKVRNEQDLVTKIAKAKKVYAWDDRVIYIIGGDYAEYGNDIDEIIISKAVVIAIIE